MGIKLSDKIIPYGDFDMVDAKRISGDGADNVLGADALWAKATSAPTAATGKAWLDSTLAASGINYLKIYDGSAWKNIQTTPAAAGLSNLSQDNGTTIVSGDLRVVGNDIGFGSDMKTKITYNGTDDKLEFYVDGPVSGNLAFKITNEGSIEMDINPTATGAVLYGTLFDDYDDPKEIRDFLTSTQKIKHYHEGTYLPTKEYDEKIKKFEKMGLLNDDRMHLQNFLKLLGGGVYQLSEKIEVLSNRLETIEHKLNQHNEN